MTFLERFVYLLPNVHTPPYIFSSGKGPFRYYVTHYHFFCNGKENKCYTSFFLSRYLWTTPYSYHGKRVGTPRHALWEAWKWAARAQSDANIWLVFTWIIEMYFPHIHTHTHVPRSRYDGLCGFCEVRLVSLMWKTSRSDWFSSSDGSTAAAAAAELPSVYGCMLFDERIKS